MPVYLLSLWSDSLTYTMARALAQSGHELVVWIADVARDRGSSWSLSPRIAEIPGARVIADDAAAPPAQIDRLIVQGHPQLLQHRQALDKLARVATSLTAVSAGDRSRSYRQALRLQWKERRWYGRWFGKVTRVVYKDGFHSMDLMGLTRSRRVVGFDAHSKFLRDAALFQALHATDWHADALRPVRANFLGSRDPEVRERILDSVERFFAPGQAPADAEAPKSMLWHAYSDAQPAALSPEDFLRALTESDFTLAPPGFSLVTHRPVEALLRGSIPVLNRDELDLYDLGLADGVNCIAVPPDGWPAAIERILDMDPSGIVGMRRNIQSMVPKRVAYPALAQHMARRLGLGDALVRTAG